jgi:glycosyltransferase involved in cell wall biosynthesis
MFESMASGTPIVAAAGGQTQLLLEKTGAGIAVPVGNRVAMTAALRRLAASPDEYQRMSLAGPAYADEHLSPARIKQQFLDIFNRVTKRS